MRDDAGIIKILEGRYFEYWNNNYGDDGGGIDDDDDDDNNLGDDIDENSDGDDDDDGDDHLITVWAVHLQPLLRWARYFP